MTNRETLSNRHWSRPGLWSKPFCSHNRESTSVPSYNQSDSPPAQPRRRSRPEGHTFVAGPCNPRLLDGLEDFLIVSFSV